MVRKIKIPSFSTSPSRDLIGPPCPLSNLRPIYYAPLFPSFSPSTSSPTFHPYSLSEFPISPKYTSITNSSSSSSSRSSNNKRQKQIRLQSIKQKLHSEDLEWRLRRYRFDSFNQQFWTTTNTQFLLAREAYIQTLPSSSSITPSNLINSTEIDLSPFYANHLAATKNHYAVYNRKLWSLQAGLLYPALQAVVREWKWRYEVWKAGGEEEAVVKSV